LREAVARAAAEKRHLRDILKQSPDINAHMSDGDIERLMDPMAYLGSAQRFIDRVLGDADASR